MHKSLFHNTVLIQLYQRLFASQAFLPVKLAAWSGICLILMLRCSRMFSRSVGHILIIPETSVYPPPTSCQWLISWSQSLRPGRASLLIEAHDNALHTLLQIRCHGSSPRGTVGPQLGCCAHNGVVFGGTLPCSSDLPGKTATAQQRASGRCRGLLR